MSAKIAVVTGRHPFDVQAFHRLFRSLPGIDAYIQHMEDWSACPKIAREEYDAVVFYNMHSELPNPKGPWYESGTKAALEELGETKQGIVMLHHGILAFPDWPPWREIVGTWRRTENYSYHFGERIRLDIADPDHPITAGLNSWEMVDETYVTDDAAPGSDILITTEHPNSMRTIAWTRRYKRSRVFCFQSGHDAAAYSNSSFRTVLRRGIIWSAGML